MRRRTVATAAAALAGLVALGACSHDSGGGGSSGGTGNGPAMAGVPSAAAGAGSAAGPVVHGAARQPATASGAGQGAALVAAAPVLSTAEIRTAGIVVAVQGAQNVTTKADAAAGIAERAGGQVFADDRTSGPHATATMTLQVPPSSLMPVLHALSQLGHERSRQLSTVDVTQRVADVASRTASAQQEIARLRKLYAQATKISDVITIESELASREANLEALEAQARTLASRTAMATVHLDLVTAAVKPAPAPPKPKTKYASGFLGGLERGWHAFAAAAAWVAVVIGALLPFLLLAAVVGIGGRLVWVRLRRQPPLPSNGPPPE